MAQRVTRQHMGVNTLAKSESGKEKSPSEMIDECIRKLGDWRGEMLSQLRTLIKQAVPEVVEEWKWMGSPVWSRDGMIAVGNAHKDKVKLTFAHGAGLPDPDKIFNAGLEGNARRAIDYFEADKINQRALKNLVRAAVDYNRTKLKKNAPAKKKAPAGKPAKARKSKST